ncbi:uncharacterized protein DSM5745_03945 [Aspergillus mulundensis]|uniref:Uncharacterized protein n=1 Tax=Aspergillus mulundensis TaxID=1810919 RepID=A0A3D8SB76_9EURO|nr:hypothetical protein DSM5745_03945 [Aspergillus mulundensis]RDW83619.1 hypothetical protein DSM5745_03945 [Aspergillus mulundensis]
MCPPNMGIPPGRQAQILAAHVRLQLQVARESFAPAPKLSEVPQNITHLMHMFTSIVTSGEFDRAFERFGITEQEANDHPVPNPARILLRFEKFYEWVRTMGWAWVDEEGSKSESQSLVGSTTSNTDTESKETEPNAWTKSYNAPTEDHLEVFHHNMGRILEYMIEALNSLATLAQAQADGMGEDHIGAAAAQMIAHFHDAYRVTGFLWEMERWLRSPLVQPESTPGHDADVDDADAGGTGNSETATEPADWNVDSPGAEDAEEPQELEYPETIDSEPETIPSERPAALAPSEPTIQPPTPQTQPIPLQRPNPRPRTLWPVIMDPPLVEGNMFEDANERYVLSLMRAHPAIHWGRVFVAVGVAFFHKENWAPWVRRKREFVPPHGSPAMLNMVVYNLLNFRADDVLRAGGWRIAG